MADTICHAVWLYFRFSLSFRDVEELLAQRGIEVGAVSPTATRLHQAQTGQGPQCLSGERLPLSQGG